MKAPDCRYPHVQVRLIGKDSNGGTIIGLVARALREQVSPAAADEFTNAAFDCTYPELLGLAMSTVDVV